MLKIIGIKTNEGYLITDNIENTPYFTSSLKSYKINGDYPSLTFKQNWFKIENKPEIIERVVPSRTNHIGFKLKNASLSDKFKESYLNSEVFDENYDYLRFFEDISGLYERVFQETESYIEPVEFQFEEILEIEVFKEPSKFSYKRAGQYSREKYRPVTNYNIEHDFIGSILIPEILKHELPCKLSQKETYDIIRAYIKDNINPKVAVITSDYDFCFTVKKKISLTKEHVYQVDVNNSIFYKKKNKPKYETRVQKIKEVQIFEMCHSPYNEYTPIKPFEGDNEDDLKQNIDNYLNHLISVINEPLKYCECCNGTGVILDSNI